MIPDNKPATPAEALIHFGTKGMRWGISNEHDYIQKRGNRMAQLIADKPSIDEVMAHVGVKGMKWGHTTGESGSSGSSGRNGSGGSGGSGSGTKKVKPTTEQIKAARVRQTSRELRYEGAVGDHMVARTAKGEAAAEKVMRKLEKELYLGPDAKTASKYTKGEKIATGIAYGVAGALIVAGLAVNAGAGTSRRL
jgi:hypothetical protein